MMTMSPEQQASFTTKRNLLVPPIPQENEPTEHTPHTESNPDVHASSSQPKDKGKTPATEDNNDDEETE